MDTTSEEEQHNEEEVKLRRGRKPTFSDPEEHKKYWNQYFNRYYKEKVAGDFRCEHCGQILANPSNFRRHQKSSKKCQYIRNKNTELERAYNV